MKIKQLIRQAMFPIALLGLLLFAVGCGAHAYERESVNTLTLTGQNENGSALGLLSITSTITNNTQTSYHDKKQNEVLSKLEAIINSGEYNIASVKTFYHIPYLVRAEITYYIHDRGDGNNLRVIFVRSIMKPKPSEHKDAEVESWIKKIVESEEFHIVKIHTMHFEGHDAVGEVYYLQK